MQCIHLCQAECQAGDLCCIALVKLLEQLSAGHADFLLVFLQWVCIAYSTVGSTGNVDGVKLSLDISALFLYILHVLASNLAGTLIVVVASCCCWLATHVQNLMHTW